MGSYNLHCTQILYRILLFFFFFIHNIAASGTTNELSRITLREDAKDPCANASCGQGVCVASSASLLGYDCVCRPGWSKMQLGPVVFPACTVPNCTINSGCGNGAPPPPPPPPASVNAPPFNLLNPCNLVWCGDGTCVANGLGYYCKCNNGSANLFNLTGVACLNECYVGADCKGVTFGSPSSPPPPPPGNAFGQPASFSLSPPEKASSNVPNCSTSLGPVILILLSLIFLACM